MIQLAPYIEVTDDGQVTAFGERRGHIASAITDSPVILEVWKAWLSDRPLPAGWGDAHRLPCSLPPVETDVMLERVEASRSLQARFASAFAQDNETSSELHRELMVA